MRIRGPLLALRTHRMHHWQGGRVLFAGEASCELLYGTVHGAIVSGLREGLRILNATRRAPVAGPWVTRTGERLFDMCESNHGRPPLTAAEPLGPTSAVGAGMPVP